MEFLLPQALVLTLDVMVTLSLWLNYRSSRLGYLAIACAAGGLELLRQLADNMLILFPGVLPQNFLLSASTSLQFFASFVLLHALRESNTKGYKIKFLMPVLVLLFFAAVVYRQTNAFEASVLNWYFFFCPLLLTRGLMIWWAWSTGVDWPLSRICLLLCSIAFLAIRGWMPAHMQFDNLYYVVYYMETLVYAMLLGALSLTAMEQAKRHVQSLLEDRMQAEKDLQFILDHSLDVILITDETGKLLSWSLKGEEKFGYTSEQAIGKLNLNSLISDQHSAQEFDGLTEFDTQMMRADGTHFRVKARVQSVERNKHLYRIYVLQDISAQHDLLKKKVVLDRQLDRSRKLESLGVLAGGIAHDFNNILTALFGNISMAKEELPAEHRAWKFLDGAENSLTRATHLSGQLLTFAKGGEPIKERVQLGELIEEIVRFDLSGSNVLPIIKQEKDLWVAEVDKGQVQQIFSNLTINANHAMPDGGHIYFDMENAAILEDEVPALNAGKYICITVRDEGIGIEQENLEQIFDPYFSTKKTGSGLGLTTAYSIITKHGGHISVESSPGEGTSFTIYLPASDLPLSVATKKQEKQYSVVPQAARVLVMDDDEMICEVAAKMLVKVGFSVDTVAHREDAIKSYKQSMLDQCKFKLVILDLTIPGGIGGKEVVKDILEIDADATVLVSSGYADDPVLANYEEYGFKGVIAKPYTMVGLKEALHKALHDAPH